MTTCRRQEFNDFQNFVAKFLPPELSFKIAGISKQRIEQKGTKRGGTHMTMADIINGLKKIGVTLPRRFWEGF